MPREGRCFHRGILANIYPDLTSQFRSSPTHNMAFGRNSFEKYLEPCNAVPTADPFADAHALRRAEVKRIDEGRPLSDIDWIPPHVVEMGMPPEHMQLLPWLRKGARATADSIRDQAHNSVGSPFDVDELPTDDIMTIGGEGLSLRDLYSLAVPGNCVSVKIIDVLLRELRTNTNGFFVVLPSEIMDHRNWQAIIFHNNLGPVDIEVCPPFFLLAFCVLTCSEIQARRNPLLLRGLVSRRPRPRDPHIPPLHVHPERCQRHALQSKTGHAAARYQ
jgi:hypothetical protein